MPADASTREPSQFDVGYAIAPVRRVVSRENIEAYRSASGDHNRIHYDDEFAAATRFERRDCPRHADFGHDLRNDGGRVRFLLAAVR